MKTADDIRRRMAEIERDRETMRAYLDMKREDGDWHGVEDAASDIRDLEAALHELCWVLEDE